MNNDNGKRVDNGVYYIKVEEKDSYGHNNIIIKDIQIMNIDEYVELKIFNSAGELVKIIRQEKKIESNIISLQINDIISIGNNEDIIIKYGEGTSDIIKWDGKNDQGLLVTSGIYEIQITVKTHQEKKLVSKTIQIYTVKDKKLKNFKIIPNPYKGRTGIKFIWECEGEGEINIKIYNMAGEEIRRFNCNIRDKYMEWDAKTTSGSVISNGLYICVIETKTKEGIIERKQNKIIISYD